jgi:RHS repeat-associated protein
LLFEWINNIALQYETETFARTYDPYGVVTTTATGNSASAYGFTGEWTDPGGLVYLRARHYAPGMGRFLTRDTWPGEVNRPLSLNRWGYVEGNPVRYSDPSGFCMFR